MAFWYEAAKPQWYRQKRQAARPSTSPSSSSSSSETASLPSLSKACVSRASSKQAPSSAEIDATGDSWLDKLVLAAVRCLQAIYAPERPLRVQLGMNAWVGGYAAPSGGPEIGKRLTAILKTANKGADTWRTHVGFKKLQPFSPWASPWTRPSRVRTTATPS